MKKTISAILLTAILMSLASCGSEKPGEVTTTGGETTTEPVTETTPAISADLPDVRYDGYEFRFLSSDEVGTVRYSAELYAEEETGEPLNDAVFKRNRMVEERFGVKIVSIEQNKNVLMNLLAGSVMAGDDDFDMVVTQMSTVLANAYQHSAQISDLTYIDIDKPWWDGDIIREMAIGGKAFALTGEFNLVDNKATWCLLFNKRLAGECGADDPYELVRSGRWTLDELRRFCSLAARDLNGDGTMDHQDQWGMLSSGNAAVSLMWASGGSMGKTDGKGNVELTIDSERNINALGKIYEIFADRDSIIDANRIPQGENGMSNFDHQRQIFRDGRALFIGGLAQYVEFFRDMEDEFGIIPLPKYDENQSDYICTAQEWCATVGVVPKTITDPDRTSVIIEALCSASVSTITPEYYDTTLQRKHARDDESKEMLDLIFASRTFDVVYAYNWGKVRNLSNAVVAESNTIASTVTSMKTAAQTELDKYMEGLK